MTALCRAARAAGARARRTSSSRTRSSASTSEQIARFLVGPLRLRRPRLRVRPAAPDRLHDDQRAARPRRPAPAAAARRSSRGSARSSARSTRARDKVAREVRITGQRRARRVLRARPRRRQGAQAERVLARLGDAAGARRTSTRSRPTVWDRVLAAKGERSWAEVSAAAGHPRNHNWHVGTRGALAAAARGARRRRPTSRALERPRRPPTSGGTRSRRSSRPARRRRSTSRCRSTTTSSPTTSSSTTARWSPTSPRTRRSSTSKAGRAVLARDVGDRARAALRRLAGVDQGRRPAQGPRAAEHEWPKILEASKRLARSPLYIDDSSDLSVLDVRAKARRLRSSTPTGSG